MSRVDLVVASFLLLGCGARSALVDASSTAGTGAAPACDPGAIVQPILTIDEPDDDEQSPSLTPLADGRVGIAIAARPLSIVQAPWAKVGAFDAWGAWPPAAPVLSKVTDTFGGQVPGSFVAAAASRVGSTDAGFAVLATGPNAQLFRALDPGGTSTASGALHWVGAGLTVAADEAGTAHLVATQHGTTLDVAVVNDGGTLEYPTTACATGPLAADALPWGGGFLLAAATGTGLAWQTDEVPCEVIGPVEAASTLQIARVSSAGAPSPSSPSVGGIGPVVRLRLARRGVGGWAVWTTAVPSGVPVGLHLMRLEADGDGFLPLIHPAVGNEIDPNTFAIAPLGEDHLAVAVVELRSAGAVLVVRRYDGQGKEVWARDIAVETEVPSPVTLLASPGGDALLLVWSERQPTASIRRLRAARLGCLGDE
ncbi:Hypothetical protein A7982_02053 [Minicystis rosea]|nr:Hypothetical protein A7982_02053 [Minicystis rosea]